MPFMRLFHLIAGLSLLCREAAGSSECDAWQSRRPDWIFCDDFEKTGPLVAQGRYFEHDDNKGGFLAAAGAGVRGSTGMRAVFQAGSVEAGNLKVAFGRVPGAYFSKGIRPENDFREIYYRMFVRLQKGWKGNPYKLSRATVFAKSDWSQAMIAHLWGDEAERLKLDPASCTDAAGTVKCVGYNDFNNLKWIGSKVGVTPLFGGAQDEKWICVETHVRLNDAGKANGVHEYWIGDALEARRDGLDFLGSYQAYALNAVFFENHWNSGSPKLQERYFDNIVVSIGRIGCQEDPGTLPARIRGAGASAGPKPGRGILLPPGGAGATGVSGPVWSLDGRSLGKASQPVARSLGVLWRAAGGEGEAGANTLK